ncbi:MAG TPA: hypothetical protein PLU97_00745 [Candidatus Cryptobacteroides sp.]|nr:hypothetical protein [Candidatus Cryptobacteroides sp.]
MKTVLLIVLSMLPAIVPGGKAYIKQLQPRDSILIADQLEYGFELEGVKNGTLIALPDFSIISSDTLTLVRNWQIDTLKNYKRSGTKDIKASVILAPFEAGRYMLPQIFAQRTLDGEVDTLSFEALEMEVTAMPIDTTTFVPHDIKGQIKYPVTFKEVLPWVLGAIALAALVYLIIMLVRKARRSSEEAKPKDPPYVIALRKLDRYRSNKYWAPERQKIFYSGITDALKEYMEARFGVDAPEMTTAELFDALKEEKDISPESYAALKELFERADFVKFAKMIASDADNATVLPLSVKFVTDTYQAELEREKEASGQ